MAYSRFYSQWKDWPDISTPTTAAAMQHIEDGISAAKSDHVFVVAASNSASGQADYVCDGVADDVEINAAIAAAAAASGAAGPGCSILLRPGTYNLAATVDFSPLAAVGQIPVLFEAEGAVFYATANLTSMFIIGYTGGATQWVSNRVIIRLGTVDGNKGTYTVTQAIYMRHVVDNKIYIHNIQNVSGDAVVVDQSPVSDFAGTFNNVIEIPRINTVTTAFKVLSNTNVYQFQGNLVQIGDISSVTSGFIIGSNTNDFAFWNRFEIGSVGPCTTFGIQDKCGRNLWLVNTTVLCGTFGITTPATMSSPSTFILGQTNDVLDTNTITQNTIISGGSLLSTILNFGSVTAASNPEIRFHSGSTPTTYDTRIFSNSGTGSPGGGNLNIGCGLLVLTNGTILTNAAHEATGAGTASLGANSPAVTNTAPYRWLSFVTSDGSTVYVPAWK